MAVFIFIYAPACRSYLPGPIDRSDMPLRYIKIRDHLHITVDTNFWATNSLIFAHPDGIVLIDATWSPKTAGQVLWHAATLSLGEYAGLIVTDFSLHRTGGIGMYRAAGIDIYGQSRTPALMRERWEAMQAEMAKSFGSWRETDFAEPNKPFEKEIRLMNGKVIAYYPGPAHTPDNLVVYFPEERVLYGGSLVASPPVFMKDAVLENYAAALKDIKKFDFDIVICGHGQPVESRSILDRVQREIEALQKERAQSTAPR